MTNGGTSMTARDKILKAFEPQGTPEVGVVSCYEFLYMRDHWSSLTDVPWWKSGSGDLEAEKGWVEDFRSKTGLEWINTSPCLSRRERQRVRFERRADDVWRVDPETGKSERLLPPEPSGTNTQCAESRHGDWEKLAGTETAIDRLIPRIPVFDRDEFQTAGRADTAAMIRKTFDLIQYGHTSSPLWMLYPYLGYEGMMMFMVERPDLARYAAQRLLFNVIQGIRRHAATGHDIVWIEECLMDQISPAVFREINLPLLRSMIGEIHAQGMKSVYYFCGDPSGRLESILDSGTDAVHFEESKKGFTIDIVEMAKNVKKRCVLFGNVDSIGVLQNGSEEMLRQAINRQMQAARICGGRFVCSTGNPVTPGTSIERVRRYTALVQKAGNYLE